MPETYTSGDERDARRRSRWHAGYVISVAVTLLLALIAWTGSGTLYNTTCSWCHSLTFEGEIPVAHDGLACYSCHRAATLDGFIAAKAAEVQMVGRKVLGATGLKTATVPPRSACLDCHEDVLMRTVERGGLMIDHGTCAGPGVACTDCHWGVGHGSPARPARGIAMDRCMECHDDIEASWDCDTCHVGSGHASRPSVGSWAVTHGPEWRRTHGMGEVSTCGACHSPDLCADCHEVSLPHPGGYVNGKHGEEAKPDTSRCVACHQQSFCDDCHSVEMPHPADFLPTHSSVVEAQGEDSCAWCHVLDDCDLCHVGHVHPGNL